MRGWFCGLFLAFATFIHIQSIPNAEYANEKDSSIPVAAHHLHKRGADDISVRMNSGMGKSEYFSVEMEGEYFWQRIYYIDNTNNSSPYREVRKITKSVTSSYIDLTDKVVKSAIKAGMGVEVGAIIDIITLGLTGNMESELDKSYQNTITYKNETTFTETIEREFTVGANSFGEMFQLMYRGPGVSYSAGTVSTNGSLPLDKVFIDARSRQIPLIKDIRVVTTDQSVERPRDLITETLSGNPDINSGYGGKYVWLVPVWTTNKKEAVTKIHVSIQSESNPNYVDMAAGAGGKFRYLVMLKDSNDNKRLNKVGLLRTGNRDPVRDPTKYGWEECTSDINEGRDGDNLYLCYTFVTSYG